MNNLVLNNLFLISKYFAYMLSDNIKTKFNNFKNTQKAQSL